MDKRHSRSAMRHDIITYTGGARQAHSPERLEEGAFQGVQCQPMMNRKILTFGCVWGVVALGLGCGSTTKKTKYVDGPTDTTPETSGVDTTRVPPGKCQVAEDSLCEGATEPTGKGCPFQSLSVTPQTDKRSGNTFDFTCTKCPGGTLGINGTYRLYENDNVNLPNPNEYRETITFDGNQFENVLEAVDSATGQKTKVVAKGYYFCPDDGAYQGKIKYPGYWNVVFVYTEANPLGAFGITPGAADPCFLGTSDVGSADDIYIDCNVLWDPNGVGQSSGQYCKIGSKLGSQDCTDPF